MSKNINQVYIANPITSNASTDLMYFGQSPYTAGNDAAMTYSNFSSQFTLSSLTSTHIYVGNGSNVATSVALSGDGALSNAGALTISKIGGIGISLAGSFTTSGAFSVTQTYTGSTNVTFPTSGTLATTSQIPSGAALTQVNDTNVTLTLGGSPSTALVNAASITAGWTGQLAVNRGGTGIASFGTGVATALGQNVTGSGGIALATSPTFVTPVLGTPTSGTLSNCTFTNIGGVISGSATGPIANAAGKIQAIGISTTGNFLSASYINSAGSPATSSYYKTRATSVGSFTAVQALDDIGSFDFYGADGTQFTQCADITVQAVGTISTGIVPSSFSISTANASGALVTGLTINQNQLTTLVSLSVTTTTTSLQGFTSGASTGGTAGNLTMYSPTASKGFFEMLAADNGGNFNVIVTNASFGQSTTLTIPDPSSSTANFVLTKGTQSIANGLTITTPTLNQPNIVGTTTNNNAAAGSVGEYVSSVISQASGVSLTNNTDANVTSISLTAGDWDVWGNINLNGGSTTVLQYFSGWTSTSSATTPDPSLWAGNSYGVAGLSVFAENQVGVAVPYQRISIASTTTVYLSVIAGFTTSTCKACGGIFARRVR